MSDPKGQDYYQILELKRNCTQEEIAEAYRRLSLKYHPKVTNRKLSAAFEYRFQKLAEAYEVLSDPSKKNIYDIYGNEGLYNGIEDKNGQKKGGYKFLGNGHEIFEKFMGTANPFTLLRDNKKVKEEIEKNENSDKKVLGLSPPPIEIELECTLEELYNGCVKKIKYKKNALVNSVEIEEKEVSVDVEILKGYGKNTVLTFKGMGNEAPALKTSDLFIHIKEKKNKFFKRVNENDLIYTHQITLAQALASEPVRLTTLDNRKIAVSIDEIISPQTIKKVKGEGMPVFQKEISVRDFGVKKGDLYIKFRIMFPEYIDPTKKQEITSLLDDE